MMMRVFIAMFFLLALVEAGWPRLYDKNCKKNILRTYCSNKICGEATKNTNGELQCTMYCRCANGCFRGQYIDWPNQQTNLLFC
uniref:Conotoxin Im22.1 n=1 Tax=Conus imperialis TaxID=35631 RepID=CEM1_CONIM|nr:RecName: Full=Conotoxin Im22.1; AltName: Full=Conopeptide im005; Flags: Precursor [Conus imperialis]AME17663.1 conopeptide im005 [Conus imperialis]DAZ86151.1 TPA_inf: conotoxin precursor E [Conus ebraeus]